MKDYSRIIKNVDIIKELEQRGIEGKVIGDNYLACCPFHEDTHPSFGILLSEYIYRNNKKFYKGTYNCYSCGETGSFFDLIAYLDNIPFEDIVKRYSSEKLDLSVINDIKKTLFDYLFKKELNNNSIKVFNNTLLNLFKKPYGKYLDYLYNERKLGTIIINKFKILCCDRNNGKLNWEGRVIIPIYDLKNRLIDMVGRKIFEEDKLYKVRKIKGSDRGKVLFGLNFIKKGTPLVIVEGEFDAIYLQQFNIPAVSIGTSSISSTQLTKIIKFTDKAILSLDGDIPYSNTKNRISIKKEKNKLLNFIDVDIIKLPLKKDPNDLTEKEVNFYYKKYMVQQ